MAALPRHIEEPLKTALLAAQFRATTASGPAAIGLRIYEQP
jgi:hypothetical protein